MLGVATPVLKLKFNLLDTADDPENVAYMSAVDAVPCLRNTLTKYGRELPVGTTPVWVIALIELEDNSATVIVKSLRILIPPNTEPKILI